MSVVFDLQEGWGDNTDYLRIKVNVDWALMNFMQDWFPIESKEKLEANEKEVAREQLAEMGLDSYQKCVVM